LFIVEGKVVIAITARNGIERLQKRSQKEVTVGQLNFPVFSA
jgi:hypothetical protein